MKTVNCCAYIKDGCPRKLLLTWSRWRAAKIAKLNVVNFSESTNKLVNYKFICVYTFSTIYLLFMLLHAFLLFLIAVQSVNDKLEVLLFSIYVNAEIWYAVCEIEDMTLLWNGYFTSWWHGVWVTHNRIKHIYWQYKHRIECWWLVWTCFFPASIYSEYWIISKL